MVVDRRSTQLLLLAGAFAVVLVALVIGAHAWDQGRSLDALGLTGFMSPNGWTEVLAWRVVRLGDPASVALIAIAIAALALASGRPRVALAVLALVAATSLSSQALKAVLADGLDGPFSRQGSFPSGHSTAAMALALGAVLASPRPSRPAAAVLGGLLAFGVGASTVALGWHFPSDVLGGYVLAAGWALVLVAALREADRRFPRRDRWAATAAGRAIERIAAAGVVATAGGITVAALLAGAALIAGDPAGAAAFAREHTTSVLVAAAVALAAAALPVTVLASLRDTPRGPGRGSAAV